MRRVLLALMLLGCGASSAQLQQTETDSLKLGGCILAQVFAGVTDPVAIGGQCVGALPAVIVDVIDDFEAPHGDAGASAAAQAVPPTNYRALLDLAKANAVAALAHEATSK